MCKYVILLHGGPFDSNKLIYQKPDLPIESPFLIGVANILPPGWKGVIQQQKAKETSVVVGPTR